MKFHFPNPFDHLKLPTLHEALPEITAIMPVLGGGLILQDQLKNNPQGVKNSLYQIHDFVKKDVGSVSNVVGKGLDKMMLPLMIVGGVVLIVMLKK